MTGSEPTGDFVVADTQGNFLLSPAQVSFVLTNPNVTLTQLHNLTVQQALFGLTNPNVTLTQLHNLTVQNINFSWRIDLIIFGLVYLACSMVRARGNGYTVEARKVTDITGNKVVYYLTKKRKNTDIVYGNPQTKNIRGQ